MHPQIHPGESDGAGERERGHPYPRRTAQQRYRERAEGRGAVSRWERVILGLIYFHIVIRYPCGRSVAAYRLLDDYLTEDEVEAEGGHHDQAGLAESPRYQHRYHEADQPDEAACTGVGEHDHYLVQHGAMDHRHPLDYFFIEHT